MVPIAAALLKGLAASGLSILASALEQKGKQVVEEKLGVKIPEKAEDLTPELVASLKQKELEHEEFLIQASIAKQTAELEAEKAASQEVTKRWEVDMLSDSWLSKNIRPLALAGTLIFVAFVALLSAADISIQGEYISLFKELLIIMIGAYFVGRSVEKTIDIHQGWTQTKGD